MDFQRFVLFPFRDEGWVKKLLIGCVILIVPVLNILTLGYFLECIRIGRSGRQVLPDWDRIGDYIGESLIAFAITLIYLLIPVVLGYPIFAIPVVGVIILSILVLLAGLFIPFALASFSETQSFADAFRIMDIFNRVSRIFAQYVPAYFLFAIAVALGLSIIFILPHLSFLGVLLIFYSAVLFFNLVGTLY
ncbi:MAG: DUF4013 domain-containing protein [Syntrophomonas sp.]